MALAVYFSRCNGALEDVVDIEDALDGIDEMASVVRVVEDFSDPAVVDQMAQDVANAEIDAIVLAGPSHEYYVHSLSAHSLTDRLEAAGVNANRIVAANVLEQVGLAHPDDPQGATRKAAAMVRVAVMRATMAPQIDGIRTEPRRAVMILGMTAEAVVAAQRLLRLGYGVVLADRLDGGSRAGRANQMRATSGYVMGHPNAQVIDEARLVDGEGWLGDYNITLDSPLGRSSYRVGGILLTRPDHTEWVDELRGHFKVDVDDNGFARSIDPSSHPAETVDPGIMVVPIRRADALDRDKVAAADSAVLALVLRLEQEAVIHYQDVSAVDRDLCGGCATCVRTCAFGACSIGEDGVSQVDIRRCRGCGKCVVSCPVGARDIMSSPHDYLLSAVRELAAVEGEGDRVLGFLCGGCGYPAADNASTAVLERGAGYPSSFMPIRIPCGGRLDTLYVLEAFKAGFDAVCVYRCREGHCHNLIGNLDMDRRINLLRTVLRSRGMDDSRLRIVDISPSEGERFIESVEGVYAAIGTLTNGRGGAQ
jgi:heterodisulfide reductase subunit A-like polyferredoxin/coenzyme F420-reducing hydrogenase delta subunit